MNLNIKNTKTWPKEGDTIVILQEGEPYKLFAGYVVGEVGLDSTFDYDTPCITFDLCDGTSLQEVVLLNDSRWWHFDMSSDDLDEVVSHVAANDLDYGSVIMGKEESQDA